MKSLLAAALLAAAVGLAAPAQACLPYDGSCGYYNPDPHNGGPGWMYGGWYGSGWYGNHWWPGGYWYGSW